MKLMSVLILDLLLRPRRRRVTRKVRRLCAAGDGWLILRSAIVLALTRISLSVCRFQTILAWLCQLSTSRGENLRPVGNTIDRITWAVEWASSCVPGAQHCLTQALTAKYLLARRGVPTELRIGVAKSPGGSLKAHAWLESRGAAVFGVRALGLEEYRPLPPMD
jgi:hypothetical protein